MQLLEEHVPSISYFLKLSAKGDHTPPKMVLTEANLKTEGL